MKQIDINDKLEKGAVLARLVVELLGKPKEHINETLRLVVQRMKDEEDIHLIKEEVYEAEFRDDSQMFSAFVELEVLAENIPSLIGLCFFYMPSSIEIVEPSHIHLQCSDITDLFNDLMGKLHKLDMTTKNLRAENDSHKIAMGKLLKSSIKAIVEKERTAKEVADILTIPEDQAKSILEHMEKEEKSIVRKGNRYGTA
ncbi:hypothetical protein COV93_00430 [Candidatus Woesearchaeota archaeon CG11_big_fil_rev_8_21_14_0_20_43_8]|nr:MAG: hypothetical protein COV93_00430 [Candidatus Woesearchaeota archaeon CG11_big_fil_rev_8_21_14_0_20_43_8]PIO06919.1 MAG: hypothetical protein COT47_02260 [Candidatus Woesearchaeota archaeon CG08_land_8_20_14_0_20_43_7]